VVSADVSKTTFKRSAIVANMNQLVCQRGEDMPIGALDVIRQELVEALLSKLDLRLDEELGKNKKY
jgi:hypothetical protein